LIPPRVETHLLEDLKAAGVEMKALVDSITVDVDAEIVDFYQRIKRIYSILP
jgi:hypothetical protein